MFAKLSVPDYESPEEADAPPSSEQARQKSPALQKINPAASRQERGTHQHLRDIADWAYDP